MPTSIPSITDLSGTVKSISMASMKSGISSWSIVTQLRSGATAFSVPRTG
ncbi:MAG TPA: hypothetical protein VMR21_10510 [Vicinamibacteria bacterium]|nr:hypothetical protein [Vicinamibacteria bacterium]